MAPRVRVIRIIIYAEIGVILHLKSVLKGSFKLAVAVCRFHSRLHQGRYWEYPIRWATGSAQQVNNYGIIPCMCCIIFWGLTQTPQLFACANPAFFSYYSRGPCPISLRKRNCPRNPHSCERAFTMYLVLWRHCSLGISSGLCMQGNWSYILFVLPWFVGFGMLAMKDLSI